ncbi:MAG: phosphoribosylanthranilate isomerase [Nitrospirota bacterium]|nr:phosphoribosylanthranilate isomerase [Nitrospirota bacterium]
MLEVLMPPKIKICGITNQEDAETAVHEGADALGFVFYSQSPRYVEPAVAKRIIESLPPFVLPIGVFVNQDLDTVRGLFDDCGLALAQLHGDESPGFCESLRRPVLRALRLRDRTSFLALAEFKGRMGVRGFVVDAFSEMVYGGTGHTTDWSLAAEVAKAVPILLAGGLTSENVQEAIRQVQPYGVDVSSGVEQSPGRKDSAKIRAFIQSVRLVC